MKRTMPKPINWQDFESLCKKLWEIIWNCPSIKKNGRAGQSQHGVDIYGIPDGKDNYFGIQCKGKDEYSNAQLTIAEIDDEIEKAKTFKPKLEHFIFTTSANKDERIEEYIREKNIFSKKSGLFSIDIFSWEDIVDLIEANKSVYDWYLKDSLHKNNYNVIVQFNGQTDELILEPQYEQINLTLTKKNSRISPIINNLEPSNRNISFWERILGNENNDIYQANIVNYRKEYSLDTIPVEIEFFNSGDIALEYYKIFFYFNSDKISLAYKNYKSIGFLSDIDMSFINRNYFIEENVIAYTSNNIHPILVPGDGKRFTTYVKCPSETFDFHIAFKFISKEYQFENQILCNVKPIIEFRNISREANEEEEEGYSERLLVKRYFDDKD